MEGREGESKRAMDEEWREGGSKGGMGKGRVEGRRKGGKNGIFLVTYSVIIVDHGSHVTCSFGQL